jgi:hypothetical protein
MSGTVVIKQQQLKHPKTLHRHLNQPYANSGQPDEWRSAPPKYPIEVRPSNYPASDTTSPLSNFRVRPSNVMRKRTQSNDIVLSRFSQNKFGTEVKPNNDSHSAYDGRSQSLTPLT